MLCPKTSEWSLWSADSWQDPMSSGGIAPLRHDLALKLYLEKQASHRVSVAHRVDIWTSVFRLCLWAARYVCSKFERRQFWGRNPA